MKKLFLLAMLCYGSMTMAQTPAPTTTKVKTTAGKPGSTCPVLQQLTTLAAADDLYGLVGDNFTSKYFSDLFGAEMFTSKTNLPNVVESFVTLDREDGATYNAIIKDYGSNEAAATADVEKLSKVYADCLPSAKTEKKGATTIYITGQKYRVKLQTYHNSNTNSWVTRLTVKNY